MSSNQTTTSEEKHQELGLKTLIASSLFHSNIVPLPEGYTEEPEEDTDIVLITISCSPLAGPAANRALIFNVFQAHARTPILKV
jgi:hypothetical protein